TAPNLHIGHAVNLWMLRMLQDIGHTVVFLIGDFTTQIGDPTGRDKNRAVISKKEIEENTQKFIDQIKEILRFDNPELLEIRKNSEWYDKMSLSDFLKLLSMITHSRLIDRDMFEKRIETGKEIFMHELVYSVLQGYDSVVLESDLTIVGADQISNESIGRFYQRKFNKKEQVIITTKVTHGIDGAAKQSKSLDNYIGLGHSASEKIARLMKLHHELIMEYFEVYTLVPLEELQEISKMVESNPFEAKKKLAIEIVSRYHGHQVAEDEMKQWERVICTNHPIENITEFILNKNPVSPLEVVVEFFGKKRHPKEIKNIFEQGGVNLNGNKVVNLEKPMLFTEGDIFRAGKKTWFKIKLG
ncbi:MAG: tyrosine--tRNA ligase, partial [archaeon]|nr:tyrosine--tRNA ligase [archaeon]